MRGAIPFSALPAELQAKVRVPRSSAKVLAKLRQASDASRREQFAAMLRRSRLPEAEAEYRFHPTRKWRFDYAWPSKKIALEVEGGVWTQGRHTRGSGFLRDVDKYNAAGELGWRVFRCTPDTLTARETERLLRAVLREPKP